MTSTRNSNVQLLATLVDSSDYGEGEYRFLVDEKHVKYVTVDPGVLPRDDRTFALILIATLPPFPAGDWNEGHISKDPLRGHPKLDRLHQNMHVVTHPLFHRALVVKFAEFPWQMPFFEAESTAYEWIDGQGVGPKFLGHLTEAGRAIGFVMEYIDDARSANTGDLAACQGVLAKLHSLCIKYGDINEYNFLVREGEVVLIDFETAQRRSEKKELEAEFENQEHSLSDSSRKGGTSS
ncbi:hypothetical protein K458DRAFT_393453 [Lentithecium fluviatile CBS 122367]|uniref:Alpha-galactosidase A n=1 Tax=Lentithecium fluviatile CBS 122367 TaxID=1168545 RepID=A0A6G1IPH4_9PLEO|nr:hypothetical protein K458DRAFT_393453 [Lentithecium fluviatile CBS 122367]